MNIQSTKSAQQPKNRASRSELADQRRENLIDTALLLFSENGYDATSIKQIGASAGVAGGLLYHYFSDKSEILKAVFERHSFLPELENILRVEHNEPAHKVLTETAKRFSNLLRRKEKMFRLILREGQTSEDVGRRLSETVGKGIKLLAEYLETRVKAGELKPHNTALTARTVLSAVLTTHLLRLPQVSWGEMTENLLAGITADSAQGELK